MAARQIIFLRKNKADFTNTACSCTASENSSFADNVRDRTNRTAWVTSGTLDSNNTTFTCDFTENRYINEILLIKQNFKSYTIKYWNGSAYTDFATPIDVTNNSTATVRHSVTEVSTSKIQITIRGTFVADADKYLYQLYAGELMGQLAAWPVIKAPTHDKRRVVTKLLSGRVHVNESLGGFRFDLEVANWVSSADLTIVERMYSLGEGFHAWLCGGDQDQFSSARQGYRLEDLYLVRPVNEYQPEFVKGLYKTGLKIKIQLAECAD